MSIQRVIANVKKHKRFLITTHVAVEGDALGSALACRLLLQKLGKKARIIVDDIIPEQYKFLFDTKHIGSFSQQRTKAAFDCCIVLDCSDLSRSGRVASLIPRDAFVINIDHHVSNSRFGSVQWINPDASSCCEMIFSLYKSLRVPFDRRSSLFLYAGLLTDTGSFRFSNTSSSTHLAAAELVKHGICVTSVYRNIYENIPPDDLKLFLRIVPKIRIQHHGTVAWVAVSRNLLKKKTPSFDLSEHILTLERSVEGVEVALLFKENLSSAQEVRINFRSRGKIDVNALAGFFGGGGHKTASGCTVRGRLLDVRRKVLRKIKEIIP